MKSLKPSLLILILRGLVLPSVWCAEPQPETVKPKNEASDAESRREDVNKDFLEAATYGDSGKVKKLLVDGDEDFLGQKTFPYQSAQDVHGDTALMLAIRGFHYLTINAILKYGQSNEPNFRLKNDAGDTALIIAARMGLDWLIQKFFDEKYTKQNKTIVGSLDLQNQAGNTAFIETARGGHCEAMRLLIKAGADPKIINKKGNNALMVAAYMGNKDAVQIILDLEPAKRPDINFKNTNGNTALTFAVTKAHPKFGFTGNNTKIAQTLIRSGADTTIKNNAGKDALNIAKDVGNKTVIKEIEAARDRKQLQKAPSTPTVKSSGPEGGEAAGYAS